MATADRWCTECGMWLANCRHSPALDFPAPRKIKSRMGAEEDCGLKFDFPYFNNPDNVKTLRDWQKEISQWQDETFGFDDRNGQRQLAQFAHLSKEVLELYTELVEHVVEGNESNETIGPEIADCFILLIGIASTRGIDVEDAIRDKMAINRARKWSPPDEDGVCQHEE